MGGVIDFLPGSAIQLQFNADNVRLGLRKAFWFPSFMGMADFILAGEGDLYDIYPGPTSFRPPKKFFVTL